MDFSDIKTLWQKRLDPRPVYWYMGRHLYQLYSSMQVHAPCLIVNWWHIEGQISSRVHCPLNPPSPPRTIDQGCQVLETEKCQTLFLNNKKIGFHYLEFYRLKTRATIYSLKFWGQPILKKAKFVFWPRKGQTWQPCYRRELFEQWPRLFSSLVRFFWGHFVCG